MTVEPQMRDLGGQVSVYRAPAACLALGKAERPSERLVGH